MIVIVIVVVTVAYGSSGNTDDTRSNNSQLCPANSQICKSVGMDLAECCHMRSMSPDLLIMTCIKFASSDTLWERVHDTLDFEHLGQNELLRLVLDRSGSTRKRKRENAHEKEFPDGTTWRRLSFSQLVRACAERNIRHSGERPSMIACLEHACGEDACGQDY